MQTNKIDCFIEKICDELKFSSIKKVIYDEIKSHMNDKKESYLEEGIEENIAEEQTILSMGDSKEIGQRLNKIHRPKLDLKLLITSILILFFGIIVSYSLSKTIYKYNFGSEYWFLKNIIYVLISIVIGSMIYFFDYTKLKNKSFIIFLITTVVGVVFVFFSNKNYLNYRIDIPFLNAQIFPTDILLPLYIISFAGFINIFNLRNKSDIIKLLTISIISIMITGLCNNGLNLFIMLLSYISIISIEIYKGEKYNNKYKLNAFIIFLIISIAGWIMYRYIYYQNIDVNTSKLMIDIREDILVNSKIIGENSLQGDIGNKIKLTDWAYGLQDAERTEIFVYIIGKYGYSIGLILLIFLSYLYIRMIINIKSIKELYGKYIIVGFATMIIIQSIFNILSNLCYISANSAALPLVSYSNFNMVFNIVLLSIILCIYRRKDIVSYN